MNNSLLVLEGIRKSFGARRILDIARVELAAGESYVLTGENGSGKTTLLRVLAGLEAAEAGACRYEGRPFDLHAYPKWLRHEAVYVHQHPYLFRGSIVDNISYGLKARGMAATACQPLVREAIAWAGVGNLLDVPPQSLSGGEKQRVALARARVLHPRQQTMELIRDLCDANSTVLLACHDREIIELPHMQRLHMENGSIDAQGSNAAAG